MKRKNYDIRIIWNTIFGIYIFETKDLDYKKEVYLLTTEADADMYFQNIVLSGTWDRNNLHLIDQSITCYHEKFKDAVTEIQANTKLYGFGYAYICETQRLISVPK